MSPPVAPSTLSPAPLLTAEEYVDRYPKHWVELIRGVVKEVPRGGFRHGAICANVIRAFGNFVFECDRGRAVSHDAFLVTGRNPDTVRGADLAYYSYERLPRGRMPRTFADAAPELAVEVRSPEDTWTGMLTKAGEYLGAGALVVIVLDPDTLTASVFRPDALPQILYVGDTLTIPDVLPGFAVEVARLFE